MKQILIDGQLCTFFLERASDGGMIVNAVAPDGDAYLNYRHWFQDPAMAWTEFAELNAVKAKERIDQARRTGISGRLHGLDS